ncbi:MAG TPA: hypothetical protein VMT53_26040 [Terriglobales bacterium]|nr:hypothetical protein [Terriglobales bacterium]
MRLAAAAFVFCTCFVAQAYQEPASSPTTLLSQVTLHDGQEIVLRNIDPISSNHSKAGDVVQFEVIRDLSDDGLVVVPEHAIAVGKIVSAEHAKLAHHGGKLAVAIQSVQLTNGDYAALRAVESRKERNFGWQNVGAATLIAATIYYLPMAPVYLMAKGEDVNIPAGSRFTAFVDGDVKVDRSSLEAIVTIPEANPNVAKIIVFRGNHDQQPGVEQSISCGKVLVGALTDTTYVQFAVAPGRYWVYAFPPGIKLSSVQQMSLMVELTAEAGKTYYLEVELVRRKWGVNVPILQPADETAGAEAVFTATSGKHLSPVETLSNAQLGARPKGVKLD